MLPIEKNYQLKVRLFVTFALSPKSKLFGHSDFNLKDFPLPRLNWKIIL